MSMSSRIFLTGALGFLCSQLIPKLVQQGNELTLLVRSSKNKSALERVRDKFGDEIAKDVEIIEGDLDNISLPGTVHIDVLVHAAAMLDLGESRKDEVWHTNVEGTRNIINFCREHNVRHLTFISTAYTEGRNIYELSKAKCEEEIKESGISYTILKPSVIIGSPDDPGPTQAINHIALTIARLHRTAEMTRLSFQDKLALPPFEFKPIFRMKGNPNSTINLIPVDVVAQKIAKLKGTEGVHYITNPNPPKLKCVAGELGEALLLDIKVCEQFTASPIEKILHKSVKPFLVYMQGEPTFPTVVSKKFRLPKGYVKATVKTFLNLC